MPGPSLSVPATPMWGHRVAVQLQGSLLVRHILILLVILVTLQQGPREEPTKMAHASRDARQSKRPATRMYYILYTVYILGRSLQRGGVVIKLPPDHSLPP